MENTELIKQVSAAAQIWLDGNYDAETKSQVKAMLNNDDKTDLIDSFYRTLEFGTGGLRGIMGVGTNRMNIYTVGAATQGFANYLKKQFASDSQISVVIGHDCRNNSRKFAEISADILSANGIKVYLFDALRPTPEVSFAIRELKANAGINITASHNPKEYNGYKAYWNDGAQLVPPHDKNVIDEVNAITRIDDIRFQGNKELIQIIGEDIDNRMIESIKAISLSPDAVRKHHDMKIVYTPIHGTGIMMVPKMLKEFGFDNIINVPEQDVISGDFPTVTSPNPEEPAALKLAVEKAKAEGADLVIASDPDADREGIAVRNDNGEFVLLTGNQTGSMLTYYLARRWKELGKLKGNEYMVKTIVTSETFKRIADRYGIQIYDVYTGFKWIAAVMLANEGKKTYIGGGEESYGYLPEDFVRDKDAISTIALIAEMAAWAKENGMTVYQLLKHVYMEFGYSKEKGISIVKKGKSGADEIKSMMANYRQNPPKELAGSSVTLYKDFASLKQIKDGVESSITDMPCTSDVIQLFTEDGTKVSIRPSGTEPKIKFYIEILGKMDSENDYERASDAAEQKINAVRASLGI